MKLGRNDPCHCGSGRKYKKCHQRADETRAREVRQLGSLGEWVAHYGDGLETAVTARARASDAVQAGARQWFGTVPDDPLADRMFRQHAVFDLAIAEGATLIETAQTDTTGAEPAEVEALAKGLSRSWLSVHEVTECKLGKGIRLIDRLTGRNRWLADPEMANTLEPLEMVLGRVLVHDKKPVLLAGWEKIYFHGRKAVVAELDAEMTEDGFEADDADGRILWLRRQAATVARRARAAADSPVVWRAPPTPVAMPEAEATPEAEAPAEATPEADAPTPDAPTPDAAE